MILAYFNKNFNDKLKIARIGNDFLFRFLYRKKRAKIKNKQLKRR